MGFLTGFKAQKAKKAHQEGRTEEAMQLYQEVLNEGYRDPSTFLSYSVLLIRNGQYAEAREMLVKNQKLPMSAQQKNQLFVNYAACVYKMGELEKGIELLERQHQKQPSGMVYETLGYLYIETGDAEKALVGIVAMLDQSQHIDLQGHAHGLGALAETGHFGAVERLVAGEADHVGMG